LRTLINFTVGTDSTGGALAGGHPYAGFFVVSMSPLPTVHDGVLLKHIRN
jgi:hypothetical protein